MEIELEEAEEKEKVKTNEIIAKTKVLLGIARSRNKDLGEASQGFRGETWKESSKKEEI